MAAGYWPRATKTRRRGVGCRGVAADRENAMHRNIMARLSAAAVVVAASGALAQSFPSRPVTLIVPWPAGGTTDLVMRALATATEKHLGQSVTIENRPGAAGTLGPIQMAATAGPRGSTSAHLTTPVFRAPFMRRP